MWGIAVALPDLFYRVGGEVPVFVCCSQKGGNIDFLVRDYPA